MTPRLLPAGLDQTWHSPRVVHSGAAFGLLAPLLIANGYSPVPEEPGEKRPLAALGPWQRLRTDQLLPGEVERIAQQYPNVGLGVAGGFKGLVPIDFDIDDPEIEAAIRSVLPEPLVEKKGRRGFTSFYRDPSALIKPSKFKTADGAMLVELLSSGQTVIPPTPHPETGEPYRWLTDCTLLDTCVDELPELPPDANERLAVVLAKWLPQPKAYSPLKANIRTPVSGDRMRSYAEGALRGEAMTLASMAPKSGRNRRLYDAACKLGKFVWHDVLSEDVVRQSLLQAAENNGLLKEDGQSSCNRTITSGLSKAKGDDLPLIEDRPRTNGASAAHGNPVQLEPEKKADEGQRKTQAQILIEIGSGKDVELFHARDGTSFADVMIDGHRETWALKSDGFRRYLRREYWTQTSSAPNSDAMSTAMGILEAKAHYDGPMREVHLRVANMDDRIYLDLCDPKWRAVEIDSSGWRIVDRPAVRFRRTRGMLQIPDPISVGEVKNLGNLRDHLHVDDDNAFVLVVSWLLAILRGRGPYPILTFTGEMGTGKSFTAEMLRTLLDPNSAPLRSLPRDARDLYVAAINGQVLVFDNLSGISPEISDCLCRLSTGGGFSTRALYTDGDEVIFDGQRAIAMTSINDVANRSDLNDRALVVKLQVIPEDKRKTERELRAAFDEARPRILGALLDVVAHGLMQLPTTSMNRLPRMADFALWIKACETAIWAAGMHLAAYEANREESVDVVLDSDPVAAALRELLRSQSQFRGTCAGLLVQLTPLAGGDHIRRGPQWPRTPQGLSGQLRRLAPALRKIGVTIEHSREGHARERILHITSRSESE